MSSMHIIWNIDAWFFGCTHKVTRFPWANQQIVTLFFSKTAKVILKHMTNMWKTHQPHTWFLYMFVGQMYLHMQKYWQIAIICSNMIESLIETFQAKFQSSLKVSLKSFNQTFNPIESFIANFHTNFHATLKVYNETFNDKICIYIYIFYIVEFLGLKVWIKVSVKLSITLESFIVKFQWNFQYPLKVSLQSFRETFNDSWKLICKCWNKVTMVIHFVSLLEWFSRITGWFH